MLQEVEAEARRRKANFLVAFDRWQTPLGFFFERAGFEASYRAWKKELS